MELFFYITTLSGDKQSKEGNKMKRRNQLSYLLWVFISLALLIFLTVSCEYIVDPDAPAWGEIVITSQSTETDSETPGYLSATGVINIEEGVVTDYEWESDYVVSGDGTEYYAEAGYVDFTGPDLQEEEDTLLQKLGLRFSSKNSEGGWYSNLVTMKVYMEQNWDYEPVEVPELIPGIDNLMDVYELEWQDDRLTAMIDYYDGYYYTYTPEFMSDSFGSKAINLPFSKTEYVYESATGNLERIRGSIWNGEGFDYTDVTIHSGYDSSGNPDRKIYYWVSRGSIPQDPDINGTAEVTTIDFWGGEFWPEPGDYFEIYSPKGGYYVWFPDVEGAFDPEPAGLNGIRGVTTEFDNNIDIEMTANAINAVDAFSATVSDGNDLVVTNVIMGNVPDANSGNTSLPIENFSITQGWPNADTTRFLYEYDTDGKLISLIIDDSAKPTFTDGSEKHTFSYDENGSIRTLTISFFDSELETWEDNTTLIFNIPEGIPFNFNDLAPWLDPIGNTIIGTLLPN
jgi:hypothetical protein